MRTKLKPTKYTYGCRSGKRRFTDYSTAYFELTRIQPQMEKQGEKVVRDIYRCSMCEGFHLTSARPGRRP